MLFDEIIQHRILSGAIPREEETLRTNSDDIRMKRTTRGIELCTQWKDGSTDWVFMKDLKDSYPIELAKYSVIQKIDDFPVFAWQISHILRKRQSITSKLKTKYWQ